MENTTPDSSLKIAPNPFSSETSISFSVYETDNVSLKIYNTENKEIAVIIKNKKLEPGEYSFKWSPKKRSQIPL
ncbi:MAG: hypothetical protein B6D61_13370 [Bacteroidetes bacterium 4484_249]|nr:MAG: hypothetical protein B6D61_13370 [Bacteroidetes bacterium 4484_249]